VRLGLVLIMCICTFSARPVPRKIMAVQFWETARPSAVQFVSQKVFGLESGEVANLQGASGCRIDQASPMVKAGHDVLLGAEGEV